MIRLTQSDNSPQPALNTNVSFLEFKAGAKIEQPIADWCACSYLRKSCEKPTIAILEDDYYAILVKTLSNADVLACSLVHPDTFAVISSIPCGFLNAENTLWGAKYHWDTLGECRIMVSGQIGGSDFEFVSAKYKVVENTRENTEGTCIIETHDNGEDVRNGIDFSEITGGWWRMIRAEGEMRLAAPEIEVVEYQNAERTATQIQDSVKFIWDMTISVTLEQFRTMRQQLIGQKCYISRFMAGMEGRGEKKLARIRSFESVRENQLNATAIVSIKCVEADDNFSAISY